MSSALIAIIMEAGNEARTKLMPIKRRVYVRECVGECV